MSWSTSMEVHFKSFTQIGNFHAVLGQILPSKFARRLFFMDFHRRNYFNANTRIPGIYMYMLLSFVSRPWFLAIGGCACSLLEIQLFWGAV